MHTLLPWLVKFAGWFIIAGFMGMFTAFAVLNNVDKRVERERGKAPAKQIYWPKEEYPEEARRMWRIRDWSLKGMLAGVFVFIILAVTGAVLDVPLE